MTDPKGRSTFVGPGLVLALGLAVATTSAAHEEPEPVNEGWAGEVSASITAQTGQVDTFAGSIDAVGERTFDKDWLRGRFNGVYGTSRDRGENPSQDTVLQDAQGLFGDWKRTVQNRFFWQSGSEISRNSVLDRLVRVIASTGPGYRFWEGENAPAEHFDTNLGVGYRYDLYDPDTEETDPDRGRLDHNHFADLVAGFEYRNGFFQDKVDFTHTGTARMPANDPEAYVLITEFIFGIPLTANWSFRTAYYVEYNAVQPDDVKNVTTRASVGLGYTF
jgi:putative salt-induced outer membrane protein YdiY